MGEEFQSGVLLVSFDFSNGADTEICLVGRKEGKILNVLNAFEGQKAKDIYKLLTTKKQEEHEQG